MKGPPSGIVNSKLGNGVRTKELIDSCARNGLEIARAGDRWKLSGRYEARTGGSERLYESAKKVFAGGVNHNARF